jgi:hypothetical protein
LSFHSITLHRSRVASIVHSSRWHVSGIDSGLFELSTSPRLGIVQCPTRGVNPARVISTRRSPELSLRLMPSHLVVPATESGFCSTTLLLRAAAALRGSRLALHLIVQSSQSFAAIALATLSRCCCDVCGCCPSHRPISHHAVSAVFEVHAYPPESESTRLPPSLKHSCSWFFSFASSSIGILDFPD